MIFVSSRGGRLRLYCELHGDVFAWPAGHRIPVADIAAAEQDHWTVHVVNEHRTAQISVEGR